MTLSTEAYAYTYPLTTVDCPASENSSESNEIAHARPMLSMLEHPALQPPKSEILEAFLQKLETASGKGAVVVTSPWQAGWTAYFAARNEKSGYSRKLEAIVTFAENKDTSEAQLAGTVHEIARQWKHFKGQRKTQTEKLLAKAFTDGRLYDNCNEDRFMCVKLLAKAGAELSAGMLERSNKDHKGRHVFSGLTCLEKLANGMRTNHTVLAQVDIDRELHQIIANLNEIGTPADSSPASIEGAAVLEQTLSLDRIAVSNQFGALLRSPHYRK